MLHAFKFKTSTRGRKRQRTKETTGTMQGQSIFLIRSSKDKNAFDVEWRIFKSQRLKDSEPKVYQKKWFKKRIL